MNFPLWDLAPINQSVVIGCVAVLHVFISHFAVGVGIFLPLTEWIARREKRDDLIEFLKKETRFVVVLTSTIGAVAGVGIWFAISLANPDATTTLIHKFVWVWGIEYFFFFVEVLALVFYYYGWQKMDPKTHLRVGVIYAVAAYGSLFFINGILTYMLTPGERPVTEVTDGNFFAAFFNAGFWPALVMRTLVACSLAGLYSLYLAAKLKFDLPLRAWLLRYTSKWLLPTYCVLPLAIVWYLTNLPQESVQALTNGISSAGVGNLSILTRVGMLVGLFTISIVLMVFFGPYLNPTEFTRTKAIGLLLSALVVTGCGEWAREVVRKPYAIRGFLYVNGLPAHPETGFPPDLEDTSRYQQKFLPRVAWRATQDPGELMFKNQCMACHTLKGYRSAPNYLKGRDEEAIYTFLQTLQKGKENPYRFVMPPLIGDDGELRALAGYLYQKTIPPDTTPTAFAEEPANH